MRAVIYTRFHTNLKSATSIDHQARSAGWISGIVLSIDGI